MGARPPPADRESPPLCEPDGRPRSGNMDAAQSAIAERDYTWATEILTYVIRVDLQDQQARNLKAEALRQFAYTLTNVDWRNRSLTAGAELEGGSDLSSGFAFTPPDVTRAFPSNVLVRMLTTRFDPAKSTDVNMTLGLRLADVGEEFSLEIRRGVVEFHNSLTDHCDLVLTTDRSYLNRVLVGDIHVSGDMAQAIATGTPPGQAAMLDAINTGEIILEPGSVDDVTRFFSYFDDPIDVGSINLVVR
jgi:alkyl sulfatase BDS1-like metallo-beta-lactamase superfamily hydrolase